MKFREHKAIYLQIADSICDGILTGRYAEGDRLPSVRELAVQAEVNVNTVARSLEYLQQNDVVEVRRGLGNYVRHGARESVLEIRRREFYGDMLPELFATMETLGIKMDEIQRFFADRGATLGKN